MQAVAAALLCLLNTFATVAISYLFRFYTRVPESGKLLLISEILKLVLGLLLYHFQAGESVTTSQSTSNASETQPLAWDQRTAGSGQATNHPTTERKLTFNVANSIKASKDGSSTLNSSTNGAGWLASLPAWAQTAVLLGSPAVCHVASGNLAYYTLSLLPAYAHASLNTLQLVSTACLSKWVLRCELGSSALQNLALLFLAICLCQLGAIKASAASFAGLYDAGFGYHWCLGILAMLAAAVLSSVAGIYMEWLLNQQAYAQEQASIHSLQVTGIAALLNLGYYVLFQGGSFLQLLSGIHRVHLAVAAALAAAGILDGSPNISGAQQRGSDSNNSSSNPNVRPSITKVYAVTVAVLLVALASKRVLLDAAPVLCYVGALLGVFAALRMHHSRSPALSRIISRVNLMLGDCGGYRPILIKLWKYAFVAKLAVLVLLPLMVAFSGGSQDGAGIMSVSSSSRSSTIQRNTMDQYIAAGVSASSLTATINTTAPIDLLVSAPFNAAHSMQLCPDIDCSTAASCSTTDPTCCVYLHLRMLAVWDRFLSSHGLGGDYMLVYSTLLGAVTNNSLAPTAASIDVGLSATAIKTLEEVELKRKAWSLGYVLLSNGSSWWWCPHRHHPSAHFRSRMKQLQQAQQQQEMKETYKQASITIHVLWQQQSSASSSQTAPTSSALQAAPHSSANSSHVGAAAPTAVSAAAGQQPKQWLQQHTLFRKWGRAHSTAMQWHLCGSDVILTQSPTAVANISGLAFPIPGNSDAFLESTYGPDWRITMQTGGVTNASRLSKETEVAACEQHVQELVGLLNATVWAKGR